MVRTTQMAMNSSRFRNAVFVTKSALERNFSAKPSSMKPSTTFSVFIQPPDFGKDCNACGNNANNPKTIAQAKPKPAKAKVSSIGTLDEPVTALPNNDPRIGPVHENETITKVSAMKNIPTIPPASSAFEDLLAMELGNAIS